MNCHELAGRIGALIREERKITKDLLCLLGIAMESRAYVELGYPSVFEWLVKGFGYSNAAAYRRIEAARLLKAVPAAAKKLENGEVNLTNLSKAQSIIRTQEKSTGVAVGKAAKEAAVKTIEGKSGEDAERDLLALFPGAASEVKRERKTVVNEEITRVSVNFSTRAAADLKRAKEVLSHKMPTASDGEILAYALKFLLDQTDPLRKTAKKPTSAAEAGRVKTPAERKEFVKAQGGRCSYRNPQTGKICGSRFQLEVDHRQPRALGGGDQVENLRLLCRQHNLLAAEQAFGKEKIAPYRREEPKAGAKKCGVPP